MIRPDRTQRRPDPRTGALQHLDMWELYGRILAAQLEALQEDTDLERFNELATERGRVAREIETAPPPVDAPDTRAIAARIRERLAECRKTDAAVLERLTALRRGTAKALDGLEEKRAGRGGYHAAQAANQAPAERRVDVKF